MVSNDIADRVFHIVRTTFDTLPTKSKPRTNADGSREWIPCSAVITSSNDDTRFKCIALATGAKCLPASKVPQANGCILHDSHAEILAIRMFNHTLVRECLRIASDTVSTSPLIRRRDPEERLSSSRQPFAIRDDIKIFMYCSEAPCGDASMELCMDAQADATAWSKPEQAASDGSLLGRGYFSELGAVRRKPARADSPITLSKSCSDKLALKQYTSLLSSTTALLISPENAYLYGLVVPSSQFVRESFRRCFSEHGRLAPAAGLGWPGGYGFTPFLVLQTGNEFGYSRRCAGPKISNIAAAWCPFASETLINGVLQGRRDSDPKGASVASRVRMLQVVKEVVELTQALEQTHVGALQTYSDIKQLDALEYRRSVKRDVKQVALRGWVANEKDDFPM